MPLIFINYRSDDSALVETVDQVLVGRFGPDRVFLDIESLQPGRNYPEEIRRKLEEADALVVLIGPRWRATDPRGQPKIFGDEDWVRLEIARALERGIPIVPVLVHPLNEKPVPPPTAEELPENIRAFHRKQAFSIHRGNRIREDFDRLADELARLVPKLLIGDLFTQPPPATDIDAGAPSTLLRPEYEVVKFQPREELARLQIWAQSPGPTSVGLLSGPPGAGRTRLAQELCARLVREGWLAGMLRAGPSADQLRHTAEVEKPLLIVIDDAEFRTDEVEAVATAFANRSGRPHAPARLLLISGAAEDWLAPLRKHPEERPRLLFPEEGGATVELPASPADRAAHVAAARAAFADRVGGSATGDLPVPGGSLLEVHAAILDQVLRSRATTGSRPAAVGTPAGERPLASLVQHDRRHWRDLVRAGGEPGASVEALATVATVASLCRASSAEEAAMLEDRLAVFTGDGISARSYVDWLKRLFPGPYRLGAVRPGPLAEEVIAASLAADPDLLVLLPQLATDRQLTRALIVLGRAIPRFPKLARAVTTLVGVDLDRLIEIGLDAVGAIPNSATYQRALGQALRDGSPSRDLAFRLFPRFPNHVEELGPFIAIAFRVWVDVFPKALQQQMRAGRPGGGFEPFEELSDKLVDLVVAFAMILFDPQAARLPTLPDGTPLISDELMDSLRNLAVFKKWLGPPK